MSQKEKREKKQKEKMEKFQKIINRIIAGASHDLNQKTLGLSYDICRARIDHEDSLFFGRIGATLTVQSIFLILVIELFDKILKFDTLWELGFYCIVAVSFASIGTYLSNRLHCFAQKQVGLINMLHYLIWINSQRPIENRIIENSDLNFGKQKQTQAQTQTGVYVKLCGFFNFIWPFMTVLFGICFTLKCSNEAVHIHYWFVVPFLAPMLFWVFFSCKNKEKDEEKLSTIDFDKLSAGQKEEIFKPFTENNGGRHLRGAGNTKCYAAECVSRILYNRNTNIQR